MVAEDFDLEISSGRLHAHRYGPDTSRLVIGVPGLSANQVSMERLADGVPMVALDLRGRGLSEVTPAGTYGWPAHARDVLEVATTLGHDRFAVVGWSMGAGVALYAAKMAPERLERVVLVDAVAPVPPAAAELVRVSVSRLGQVYPSLETYIGMVKQVGLIQPWDAVWDRYYAYEMEAVEGGVAARTDRAAVEEDMAFGEAADLEALWPALTMPTLLIRARQPFLPGTDAHVISPEWLARFRAAKPEVTVVEVDANHYTIGTHPDTIAAIRDFFGA